MAPSVVVHRVVAAFALVAVLLVASACTGAPALDEVVGDDVLGDAGVPIAAGDDEARLAALAASPAALEAVLLEGEEAVDGWRAVLTAEAPPLAIAEVIVMALSQAADAEGVLIDLGAALTAVGEQGRGLAPAVVAAAGQALQAVATPPTDELAPGSTAPVPFFAGVVATAAEEDLPTVVALAAAAAAGGVPTWGPAVLAPEGPHIEDAVATAMGTVLVPLRLAIADRFGEEANHRAFGGLWDVDAVLDAVPADQLEVAAVARALDAVADLHVEADEVYGDNGGVAVTVLLMRDPALRAAAERLGAVEVVEEEPVEVPPELVEPLGDGTWAVLSEYQWDTITREVGEVVQPEAFVLFHGQQ